MKLEKIILIRSAIEQLTNVQLPVMTAYKVSKLKSKLDELHKRFAASHDAIIKQYGELVDEEKGSYKILDQHRDGYNKDLQDLLSIEEELEMPKFKIEELGNIKLDVAFFQILGDYIEE